MLPLRVRNQAHMTFLVLVIIFILPAFQSGLWSQEPETPELKKRFDAVNSSITELSDQRNELSAQVQNYREEIRELKDKETLNYFQRQKLEGLLRTSQDVSREIADIDAEMRTLNESLEKLGRSLIDRYDAEIKSRLAELEREAISEQTRRQVLAEIQMLRDKSAQIKQRIGIPSLQSIRLSKLSIEPDDSPKQIEQKADLLKDQEDKLRRLANRMRNQANELQKELRVRTRINEFVADISTFDQQEEALGVGSLERQSSDLLSESDGPVDESRAGTAPFEDQLSVVQKDFDFSSLSSEELEETTEFLKNQEQQMRVKADSLGQQANRFYKVAQDKTKQ